ncbi:hypothetical protein Tco_0081338, partial [Tanacetum coccineum]
MMRWLSIFNSRKHKDGIGMKIPSWIIIDEMKLVKNYRMTTSAPRTPNPDVAEGESSALRKSTVIRLRIPQRRSTRLTPPTPIPTTDEADDLIVQDTIQLSLVEQKSHEELEAKQNEEKVKEHLMAEEIEKLVEGMENVEEHGVDKEEESEEDDYELRIMEEWKHVEESRNTPSPTTIRSPRIHYTLISPNTEKLKELTVNDPPPSSNTPSSSSPKPKLSASQHILSLFKPKTRRFKRYKSFFDELQGRYKYLF